MPEEDMIFEEQIEQETAPEEVENYEEQTEQDSSDSLDSILAGVNELLEQSSSYSAYLEEGESEPQSEIVAFDNGNAVALSDLDAIAVQAANSSVYPGTWTGSILDYFSAVMRQNPGKHYVAFRNSQYSYFLYYGDDLTFADGSSISVANATFIDFMDYYEVHLMNPKVLSGMFLGSMMAFLFCGLTMNAVGRAAGHMVDEVRRQFRDIKGILTGEAEPDYERCVAISTKGAQREMVVPSLIAILAPIATGLIFGVPGVLGLLIGGLSSGFVLAIFMANAGGAWDNAKKYVEEGNFGGKGSEVHKATVVGDTVGDPFKDTSGPSLNILIKLMSMVAIVMAGLTVAWSLF